MVQLAELIQQNLLPYEQIDGLVTVLPEDEHNVKSKRPDVSKAVNDLGHDPVISLSVGVPRTLAWMRKFYNLPKLRAVA